MVCGIVIFPFRFPLIFLSLFVYDLIIHDVTKSLSKTRLVNKSCSDSFIKIYLNANILVVHSNQ